MDIERLRAYCLALPGTAEDFPFDAHTLVFKVMGKMFALIALERDPLAINLKCDPERALELRDRYPDTVRPGYHMSKVHWNTILIEGELSQVALCELVDHSYQLVAAKLKKADRETLAALREGDDA